MSCSASSSPTAAWSRMDSSLLLPLPPRLAAKGWFLSNIAVKVPQCVLIDLISRDENQQICVRWGGTYSTFFYVTNGVRQGSLLSPYLFNIYVDDLSVTLNACHVGCCVGNVIINHLMYAYDLVI